MGKYRIAVDMSKCRANDGCALECLAVCPTKVLAHRPLDPAEESGRVHIQATHSLLCDGCMECVEACEPGAITLKTFADDIEH